MGSCLWEARLAAIFWTLKRASPRGAPPTGTSHTRARSNMKRLLIVYLFAGLVMLLTGLQLTYAQVEKGTLWRDAVVTDLDVDFGGTGFHARWVFHRCHCGDLLVQVEQVAPDGVLTGELLMVDGQVLLSRGFKQQGVDIEPLMQAPSLMLQLVFELLNRSQTSGPFVVSNKQLWDETEKTRDFKLNTGLATGIFAAPWSVKGSGWKTDSGNRRFELVFQFTSSMSGEAEETSSITFSGDLDFRKQGFPYPESTGLEGWRIQWVSRNELESKPVEKGLTLKELRQQAKDF